MRPLHLTDLDLAVRVLLARPEAGRPFLAGTIVTRARLADIYRKKLRKRHAVWGDGTLAAAARSVGVPVPARHLDEAYRASLRMIIDALG